MPVSNHGVQRAGVHVDDSEIDLVADLQFIPRQILEKGVFQ